MNNSSFNAILFISLFCPLRDHFSPTEARKSLGRGRKQGRGTDVIPIILERRMTALRLFQCIILMLLEKRKEYQRNGPSTKALSAPQEGFRQYMRLAMALDISISPLKRYNRLCIHWLAEGVLKTRYQWRTRCKDTLSGILSGKQKNLTPFVARPGPSGLLTSS